MIIDLAYSLVDLLIMIIDLFTSRFVDHDHWSIHLSICWSWHFISLL